MDNNEKSRHSVWLSDEVWQEVDAFYKLDNCSILPGLAAGTDLLAIWSKSLSACRAGWRESHSKMWF